MKSKGSHVCDIVDQIMPCFFRFLNPIIHKYRTAEYHLNGNQIKVLNAINIIPFQVGPAELSKILNIYKGSMTTIVRSLVELRLVDKKNCQSDPRRYSLNITAKGISVLKDKRKENIAEFNKIFADMPEDDFNKIEEGFKILIEYFKQKYQAE